MSILQYLVSVLTISLGLSSGSAWARGQLEGGRDAIRKMSGCFLVDYSYTEFESLKPGYTRDSRVYDVNRDKSVKEWVYAEEISPERIRLQHILFVSDSAGKPVQGAILKHQSEDWEYEAPFLYEFTAPSVWQVKDQRNLQKQWTRKVTNLDDGLRYQCTSSWNLEKEYPEWACESYAPIPGRETRDMGRKDYNTLDRSTRLIIYGESFLERQENIKVIHQDGNKTPLARELGKNWYVQLPDSECQVAKEFVKPRKAFWSVLREAWDDVLTGDRPFVEKSIPGEPPRFVQMNEIEEEYLDRNLSDLETRSAAKDAILKVIRAYRSE